MGKIICGANSTCCKFCLFLFVVYWLFVCFCCFYEDFLNDNRERIVASARFVLEELKEDRNSSCA